MLIKFLFGVATIAFTSFCGYLLARKYRQKRDFFTQFKEFNERFISEVSYYRRPIGEFIAQYAYRGEFNRLLEEYFTGISEGKTTNIILEAPEYSFLKQEEKRVVEDYFLMLGKGDSSSQKGYCLAAKDGIVKLQAEAELTCKRYADLYVKLGFLCGLLILILIL